MIRLRVSFKTIRPRGVVSETVSNLRWIHRLRTFVYWDAPVLLLSVASNVSVTGRRL